MRRAGHDEQIIRPEVHANAFSRRAAFSAKVGIHVSYSPWIPAVAGMTSASFPATFLSSNGGICAHQIDV